MKDLIETLRTNEEIAQKFFEIEVSILSILNFKDLFERLLTEIREKFSVPYVWISMIHRSEISDLIQTLESSKSLKERLNVIERNTFEELVGTGTSPILVNENLEPYYQLLPPGQMYFMRSLAVAPLGLHGRIIGSLNQADLSGLRYRPGMDTRLLERLAVKVSICLSNVTAHEKLRWLASRDPLTGLLNRRVMETILRREYKRARRYKSPLALAFLDLDGFKATNDRYGHDRGDELLRYFADTLMAMTRDSDVVARYAGDEFVIILPGATSQEANKLMGRLQRHFRRNALKVAAGVIPVSFSYGVAAIEEAEATDALALLRRADTMLYQCKKGAAGGQVPPQ